MTRLPRETDTRLWPVEAGSGRTALSLGRLIALLKGSGPLAESFGEILEAMIEGTGLQRADLFLIDDSRQWLQWTAGREQSGSEVLQTTATSSGLRVNVAGSQEILSRQFVFTSCGFLDRPAPRRSDPQIHKKLHQRKCPNASTRR